MCLTHKMVRLVRHTAVKIPVDGIIYLMQWFAEDNLHYVYPDRTSKHKQVTIGKTS